MEGWSQPFKDITININGITSHSHWVTQGHMATPQGLLGNVVLVRVAMYHASVLVVREQVFVGVGARDCP